MRKLINKSFWIASWIVIAVVAAINYPFIAFIEYFLLMGFVLAGLNELITPR